MKNENIILSPPEKNHYYPFGLPIHNRSTSTAPAGKENRYLYNGKELQDDLGLNWMDYGARFYDVGLGRWHSVDPLGEKYPLITSYSYCFNNPINSIDPDGREPITLGALAARALAGAMVGASIDFSAQLAVNIFIKEQSLSQAIRGVDWTSVGASAITGAVGVPGSNSISNVTKLATIIATNVVDASMDISLAKGNQNIFNGEKTVTEAAIDVAGTLISAKASDELIRGARSTINNQVNSGSYATLTKTEKATVRQIQTSVNSPQFATTIQSSMELGEEAGKVAAKNITGAKNANLKISTPQQFLPSPQPMDNVTVTTPFVFGL